MISLIRRKDTKKLAKRKQSLSFMYTGQLFVTLVMVLLLLTPINVVITIVFGCKKPIGVASVGRNT